MSSTLLAQQSPRVLNFTPPTFNGIAVIGEAPGSNEAYTGTPFIGPSGKFLRLVLRHVGIDPNQCFFGNICQRQPPDNDLTRFTPNGVEFTEGLTSLRQDLEKLRPSLCVLLGNTPLRAFRQSGDSISNYRGTVFYAAHNSPLEGVKCISTYHPAAVLRQYDWAPVFRFDLAKAERHSKFQDLGITERHYDTYKDLSACLSYLRDLKESKKLVSIDIEGGVEGIHCIGFSTSPTHARVIPITTRENVSLWNKDEEVQLWEAICSVLSDPTIPKVLQNSLYDNFVLSFLMKCPILGIKDDTMLKHWELYPELEKSLGFQASIYTQEPYYKYERKSQDYSRYLSYCGTDCAVTFEINAVLDRQVRNRSHAHYQFNMELLRPVLYMELRGFKYDLSKLPDKKRAVTTKLYSAQAKLDKAAGVGLDQTLSPGGRLDFIRPIVCQKRHQKYCVNWSNLKEGALGTFKEDIDRIYELGSLVTLTEAENAELSSLVGLGMNIRGKEFKPWFYDKLGMPRHYNMDGALTTDYLTMLKVAKKTKHPVPLLVLEIADARTHQQMLNISTDPDNRVRCAYNLVGTDTGRMTCYTSPTGSGYNLTTIPEYDRDLFIADEGMWMFQCDLAGADGWTVACHCAAHGDPTMLDDLQSGIKVAKVLVCMIEHGPEVSRLPRAELKLLCDKVEKANPNYFACKCVQHGSNYGMKANTMSDTIFKMSEGKIYLDPRTCDLYRDLYFLRYPGITRWHTAVQLRLNTTQKVECASGHTRLCMGRPDDHETFKSALSSEPQNNTCYATNLAMHRLYYDEENRLSGHLIIEPLHQNHDAIIGQFPVGKTNWAVEKIRTYFDNKITIAGITITIPFEGHYGPSWGELPHTI
jgi:DNA polymerase